MSTRTTDVANTSRLPAEQLQSYWSRLSERFLARDPEGLAVICYAGMPPWFNSFLDRYQRMAFARLTRGVDVRGARVLDLGTGIGRWAHWFAKQGAAQVVGIDLEKQRLGFAWSRSYNQPIDYQQMSVDGLAFASETFDVVNSVTVLQHVGRDAKLRTMAEVARVLRPGGYVTLFEITDMSDDAPHVFPEKREWWTEIGRAHGLQLVHTVGDQYTPLLRLGKAVFSRLGNGPSRERIDQFKGAGPDRSGLRPSMLALRALVLLSYPLEEICQRVLPMSAARIGGFLFRKEAEPSMTLGKGGLAE